MKRLLLLSGLMIALSAKGQLNRPIKQHIDSSGIGNYKNTPKVVSEQERADYANYISGSRLGMDFSEGATFTINSIDKLFKLKEALDLIPTNRYFENNNPVLFGTGANDASPCDIASNSYNNHKKEDKLSVNYRAQNSMLVDYRSIFDVNIVTNICNDIKDPVFIVNEGKQFGFGVSIPAATYHFDHFDMLIGKTNSYNFKFNTANNRPNLVFSNNGDRLFMVNKDGKVFAKEFEVLVNIPVPDYVFDECYELMPINKVKQFIEYNKHLPGIKSACEMESEGTININEMQMQLLKKVEELTLYVIQLNDITEKQQSIIDKLNKELAEFKSKQE